MEEENITQEKRNILIRISAVFFWLILTLLLGLAITGAIVGGMGGAELNTTGMSVSEAYSAGQQAGGNASMEFMTEHSGKVILALSVIWLCLSFLGAYPWVSKYKK